MNRRVPSIIALLLPLLLGTSASPAADDPSESFRMEKRNHVEEVFNLIFGSAPPMATERGILILEAYHDRNGNKARDPGEEELEREIVCRIDEIDYSLPAFIPGLEYNGSYQMRCNGEIYTPLPEEETFFVKHRGEILRMALPCLPNRVASESR